MASISESETQSPPTVRGKRGRPRGSGTQLVYTKLREEILRLVLKPGDHIDEVLLEARFKVSRTPIREALIRLQADGLARFAPNRGHYVSSLDFAEIPKIFEALDVLQSAILQIAATRRSEEHLERMKAVNEEYREASEKGDHTAMTEANHAFHLITAEAAGNRILSSAYESVLNFNLRVTRLIFETAARDSNVPTPYYNRIYDEHSEMIELLSRRDSAKLAELSKEHTNLFYGKIRRFLQSNAAVDVAFRSFVDDDQSEPA
ncbi:GntR family transcriptional regulator [Limibacillus sp. MBR-115]|uniref:GntR family transcriptional regulator n=1 Tax=Limibacillus sp. MBR-115 TaxID=3156465 RepID=UPI003392E33D